MAMAEGERAECPEPPQDEPPADGALKRAEELKTQANDYFKGAPALAAAKGGGGGWRAAQVEGRRARAEPWQRGAASLRPGPALPSDPAWGGPGGRCPGAAEGASEGRGDAWKWRTERMLLTVETEEGAPECGAGAGRGTRVPPNGRPRERLDPGDTWRGRCRVWAWGGVVMAPPQWGDLGGWRPVGA